MRRRYLSIYFSDGDYGARTKRDVTISFADGDKLYNICKKLKSSAIRDALGVESYRELVVQAREEDRAVGNYVKHRLKRKLLKGGGK